MSCKLVFTCEHVYDIAVQVALVTGGGAGIGAHICLLMGRLGAIVVCVDIDEQQCENVTRKIRDNGGAAFSYQCDITNREAVEELHKKILEEIGDVTILVNNAGVRLVRPFLHYKDEQIERTINTNLYGQIWMLRTFLPRMIENNHGSIVSMSALAGYGGLPMMLPFTASKFAVRGLMEGLYLELRLTLTMRLAKQVLIYSYLKELARESRHPLDDCGPVHR